MGTIELGASFRGSMTGNVYGAEVGPRRLIKYVTQPARQ
jgi:hypothetical protein